MFCVASEDETVLSERLFWGNNDPSNPAISSLLGGTLTFLAPLCSAMAASLTATR